jgi:gas vesicle protein GvpN
VNKVLQAYPHQFVNTPAIEQLSRRSLRYLQTGYSVHLTGSSGTGKTTLAMHLADQLGRPTLMLFGDEEYRTLDAIGNQAGYSYQLVVDSDSHSIIKDQHELYPSWLDAQLAMACCEGCTLIYDEFNRSRPAVNNVLLFALEEKLLVLPNHGQHPEYVRVHPDFRIIFTSNSEEYCGVHATQHALLDRLITIQLPDPDELTQQQILIQKVGICSSAALKIVQLNRQFQRQTSSETVSSLRPCLMIANICHQHQIRVSTNNPDFRDICRDILLSRSGQSLADANEILWTLFNQLDTETNYPLD